MSDEKPVPQLPVYHTSHSFIDSKQQGIFNKVLGKMLAPKIHLPHGKISRQTVPIKHKKKVKYW